MRQTIVSIALLGLLLCAGAFAQPRQWGGLGLEYNQYIPDHPITGYLVYARIAPEKINPFGANYPTYWFNAVRFYSAGPISQAWTAPKEFRLMTALQSGFAQKVRTVLGITWYAILSAGPATSSTSDGTQVGLSMATGALGQAKVWRGMTVGPSITWAPSVSALEALQGNQWGVGVLIGWGQ